MGIIWFAALGPNAHPEILTLGEVSYTPHPSSFAGNLPSFSCSTRHCRLVDRHEYFKAVPLPQVCGQGQKRSPCHLHYHSEGLLPGASHLSLFDT